jgi:hypothetical protein
MMESGPGLTLSQAARKHSVRALCTQAESGCATSSGWKNVGREAVGTLRLWSCRPELTGLVDRVAVCCGPVADWV